ncbi:TSCPD domain-containing protein [Humisphaera borealis]|uniref:Vitamin B12-dependent ribonucleotide reductase n=1 Tax=Humisphaera borealis TaxID=2807512 RepID=A0A7M2X075_9BACT|nr:LAGLIDADG family homing endonuclease [Humisphaera borealis]QOV91049.1 vitamin B12-dependent ribonucleotide reductase [Humisphaera borealis]
MKITRRFTKAGQDVFSTVNYDKRTSRIANPDGKVVFEMNDAEIPSQWSQLATDIMVSKYFRKAGVPQLDENGQQKRDEAGNLIFGPEKSAKQVIHRLAGCWRMWGETHGYFDSTEDAQAFYDELSYMLLNQMCAPNSPQWFNTGLNYAYNITGPAQGHFYCDPKSGELTRGADAYTHPQPHACFIQSVADDLVNEGGIMDLWTREARLFKYGSGTGSNFSKVRGENERLSGGGKSSGLMSFLKIGDRAAGAIKSGGTTRRAAKMVCLDLDHPDVEDFVNWKVREELKVAALAEGIKHLSPEQQATAKKLGLKLDYDFNGEAYMTVSGQNSNNSVRIPNSFFEALEADGDWKLYRRTDAKLHKTIKARDLWEQISYAAWRCADPGVQYDTTINQWHTCPNSGRINASNPCVTGDTRVLTPGGIWRRIDQMIHLPARVVTNLDGQEIHVTEGAFPTGTKDVFELATAGGYKVKLTADHKIYTRRRGWVAARDLTPQDEVKLPNKPAAVQEIGEPQDARFFQMLGFFMSEANGDLTRLHLDAAVPDVALRDSFAQYVAETWGEKLDASDRIFVGDVAENGVDSSADLAAGGGTATATLTNRRLVGRLQSFVRTDTPARRLSDEAFTAGLAAQKHLLRALFTADGEIVNNTVELTSASREFLEDVQMLLLGFGVQSAIASHSALDNRGVLPASRDLTGPSSGDAAIGSGKAGNGASAPQRHGLRIDAGSLRNFGKYVGLLPGRKLQQLAEAMPFALSRGGDVGSQYGANAGNWDRVATVSPLGRQQVFDLTEPVTSSFVANGITVHNCSEYMFLDDTACNLASLNVLTFFDAESKSFDIDAYRHGIRLWTVVLEISVLMASFPSEEIATRSYKFRTLGLGYANLGAMLMQAGIGYDSSKGRGICAALTSILTGESYATSAEMAKEHGPFPGYAENKEPMLRVIRNHRRAAYNVNSDSQGRATAGGYENLQIQPVGIDSNQFAETDPLASSTLLKVARECWDRALAQGEQHGYRNAQTTVIAPTGTIGLLMDCDTTGVEPDFALVKFKKLAGGGYFKIANQSLQPALKNLGYSAEQVHAIIQYVMGTLNLEDSPHINADALLSLGFTRDELAKIESALPATFELSFAFSPWTLGADVMKRLGVSEAEWQKPNFNLLRKLGFSKRQINEANDVICGRGTVEGAPHLRAEHLPVFDCANKCGKTGERFIPAEGHIRMMAAAQPFISGAISKTINLPNEATIDEIKQAYKLSWELGLKANALYRDGSKLSQPLNNKSDEQIDDEESEENVQAAKDEVAKDVAHAAKVASADPSSILSPQSSIRADNISAAIEHTRVIEKIVERIVERPLRRRLPDTRNALTHKFDVAGHEGYITCGLYEDGQPGEVFITMAKEGSTIGGLMDTIATLVSVSLQYGVPVESLVRKFEHVRFEPSGMTRNQEIPFAKSLVDYIFRWLAMEFVPGYRAQNAPRRPERTPVAGTTPAPVVTPVISIAEPAPAALTSETPDVGAHGGVPAPAKKSNGHHSRLEPDTARPFAYGEEKPTPAPEPSTGVNLRLAVVADPLSAQGSNMQADAPACDVCGSITVRSGTCYKCLNCGNSMGCS